MENVETKEPSKYSLMVKPKLFKIREIAPDVTMSFTEEQYIKLRKGIEAKEMEDKWYIFFKDDHLHFLRSWTGLEIYRAEIVKEKDGQGKYAITEFYIETDEEIINGEDHELDFDIFFQLIFRGLLGIDTRERFIKKYGEGAKGAMFVWSIFGRLFFSE
jgi:hypothetical protein